VTWFVLWIALDWGAFVGTMRIFYMLCGWDGWVVIAPDGIHLLIV